MSTEREHRLRPSLARPTFATIDHDNPAPSCHCSGGSPRCRCWSRLSSPSLSLPRAYGPRPGIQCSLGPGSTRVCYTKTAERLVQDSEPPQTDLPCCRIQIPERRTRNQPRARQLEDLTWERPPVRAPVVGLCDPSEPPGRRPAHHHHGQR